MFHMITVLLALVMMMPIINADSVERLKPQSQINFADLPEDIRIETGWFTLSFNGMRAASVRADGGLVIWSMATGVMEDTFTVQADDGTPATVLDARFDRMTDHTVSVHTADGQEYLIAVHRIGADTVVFPYPDDLGVPVRVWFDDEDVNYVWLEAGPDYLNPDEDQHLVVRLAVPPLEEAEPLVIESAPEADTESYVRIGRIPAPLAVTSTPEGLVRLWDLESGTITAEVQLDDVPVFGRVNETTGRQLAWRDQVSQALHLLDFTTGENRKIADIGGEYIQALMLTPSADVVLAVHIGDVPNVAAWIVETGEQIDLGLYRDDCARVPDMVQLSQDGTMLVIGCDKGFDIWQLDYLG